MHDIREAEKKPTTGPKAPKLFLFLKLNTTQRKTKEGGLIETPDTSLLFSLYKGGGNNSIGYSLKSTPRVKYSDNLQKNIP